MSSPVPPPPTPPPGGPPPGWDAADWIALAGIVFVLGQLAMLVAGALGWRP